MIKSNRYKVPFFFNLNKAALLLAVAILLFGSFYKPVRSISGFEFISNYNYYALILLFVFAYLLVLENKLLTLDSLMISYFFITLTNFVIAVVIFDYADQGAHLALYICPLSVYFIFRLTSINKWLFMKILCLFAIVSSLLIYIEFYDINYIGANYFDSQGYWEETLGNQIQMDHRLYPILGKSTKPWGMSGRSQASAALFAGLFLYFLIQKHYIKQYSKLNILMMFLLFLSSFLCGSWTSAAVLIAMLLVFYIGINVISISLSLVATIFLTSALATYFGGGSAIFETVHSLLLAGMGSIDVIAKLISDFSFNSIAIVLMGQLMGTVRIDIQVDLINIFLNIGLFSTIILFLIFYYYIKYVYALKGSSNWHMHISGMYLILVLILSSLHYSCLFSFPANVIALSIMGHTARDMSQKVK
jgi:hypothetical protein